MPNAQNQNISDYKVVFLLSEDHWLRFTPTGYLQYDTSKTWQANILSCDIKLQIAQYLACQVHDYFLVGSFVRMKEDLLAFQRGMSGSCKPYRPDEETFVMELLWQEKDANVRVAGEIPAPGFFD